MEYISYRPSIYIGTIGTPRRIAIIPIPGRNGCILPSGVRGYCPLVFPEGMRTPDGKMQPFRPGIGMMAIRLGVPIVPIYIEGLYEIYSIHDSWPKRGPVQVSFGQPHEFTQETYEEAAEALQQAVQNLR